MAAVPFLSNQSLRSITLSDDGQWPAAQLALGEGSSALEVVIVSTASRPRAPALRSAWHARKNGRAAPLMLVVLHADRATLCGPAGDEPPIYESDAGQAERLCREALAQPDRHAALRFLRDTLPSVETRLPGLRNEGFLATHELEVGARKLPVWSQARDKATRVLNQRGEALLSGLGFQVEKCDQVTSILRAGDKAQKLAVAVLLHQSESPELQTDRFSGLSPVSYALAVADRENLPYVVVLQGSKLRLYPVKVGVGVGRRGRTETYVEAHTGLLRDDDAAFLWLLFSAEALQDGGTLAHLLEESKRFAGNLAENLRDRIYNFVIPPLAEGLAKARGLKKPTADDLAVTYEMAMTVLFRLLFIAYGEDKDLLPFKWNSLYQARSLKHKAQELLDLITQHVPAGRETSVACLEPNQVATLFDDSESLWRECGLLFKAVDVGETQWGVPIYNGGLFSRDPAVSRVGQLLAHVSLPNKVVGPVLANLLLIGTPEGIGPVDFRSLGVREFGTIYEGLLESELAVAETDLTVDDNGFYRPCRENEEPLVRQRHIYLHNRSGARKSTGAYFTKPFAVEHLLEHALEPALADHLARLDKLDEDDAALALFDFRVADIAMGSGHFLVAAVDHIERAFSQYLSRRSLPGVRHELAALRAAAHKALGTLADQIEIEDTQLIRRLIARRCIYGVDLNPVSVNLARLSIWIHTFVPGLPLSLLDHNLVVGNSLVGIGRVDEIVNFAAEEDRPLLTFDAQRLVGEAMEPLTRLGRIADATHADVKKARKAYEAAQKAVEPAKALCDLVTACRMTGDALPIDLEDWESERDGLVGSKKHRDAKRTLAGLDAFHCPVAFPEVFLRVRSGFDVILGNPPWEEATLEEHAFWARHEPGLRGLNQREQERLKANLRRSRPDLLEHYERELAEANSLRQALLIGPYPGMGTGDPDLYKAFCWRFWQLVAADGGWIGVVLPRSAWAAKGTSEFRLEAFKHAGVVDLTMLVNNRQWVFPEVHPQYSIGLVGMCRGGDGATLRLRGPFVSFDRYQNGVSRPPAIFSGDEVTTWTDTASLPLLPSDDSLDVFARLRAHPRLDTDDGKSWRARPHTELHATNDKKLMDLESESRPRGFWPVFKGESFDLWEPDTGRYYAWAEPDAMLEHLQGKRRRGKTLRSSVYFEFQHEKPPGWWNTLKTLPCQSPRIAFRDITRATDSRTVRAALVPPKVFITNKGPYFLFPRGDEQDEAYLLGVLASLPLDWYARRFVETSMNFFILNPFPVPRPSRENLLWQRTVQLAGRLAAVDKRYATWAEAVGVDFGPLDGDEKFAMTCELDAVVAHLYGLEERHLVHIFETFHEAWRPGGSCDHPTLGDYNERLARTREYFRTYAT